jgi:hypothetical protein
MPAVTGAALVILLTGFTSYAIIGLLVGFAIVLVAIGGRHPRWSSIGFRRPRSWMRAVAIAAGVGLAHSSRRSSFEASC